MIKTDKIVVYEQTNKLMDHVATLDHTSFTWQARGSYEASKPEVVRLEGRSVHSEYYYKGDLQWCDWWHSEEDVQTFAKMIGAKVYKQSELQNMPMTVELINVRGKATSIVIDSELATWCFKIRGSEVLPDIEIKELYKDCGMYGSTKAKVYELALALAQYARTSNLYDKITNND